MDRQAPLYAERVDIEKIRENEAKRAIDWLETHWPQPRRCPICGNNNWQVNAPAELRSFAGGDLHFGGPLGSLIPVFSVMCDRCGYMNIFNALQAGVVQMNEYEELKAANNE